MSITQKKIKHWYVISITIILNPKHSTISATRKKIYSIPSETGTATHAEHLPDALQNGAVSLSSTAVWMQATTCYSALKAGPWKQIKMTVEKEPSASLSILTLSFECGSEPLLKPGLSLSCFPVLQGRLRRSQGLSLKKIKH